MSEEPVPEKYRCHSGDYDDSRPIGERWQPCPLPQTSPFGPFCDRHGDKNFGDYLRLMAQ